LNKWYLANIIQYALIKDKKTSREINDNYYLYYENTHLIKAHDSSEAYKKANEIGKSGETRHENPDGEIVEWKFAGVAELVEIYNKLEDGEEIAYSEGYTRKVDNIKKKIPPKEKLGVFVWEKRNRKNQ